MEEFAQAACGLSGRHRLAVRGGVAGVLHEARLDGERAADQRLEARLGEQRGQRRVVGVLQRAVVPVEPADGGLQRQPAIERRAARIGMRQRLGARGMPENVGKFGLQEGELRHDGSMRAVEGASGYAQMIRRLDGGNQGLATCHGSFVHDGRPLSPVSAASSSVSHIYGVFRQVAAPGLHALGQPV